MGQRLNIEITDGDTALANCYYHWSAYTESALELTRKIIYAFWETNPIVSVKTAVELLEATGGGVNETERAAIEAAQDKFGHITFKGCTNRNEGLISVTESGMESTRRWEEGRVTIDLTNETIDFFVMWTCEGKTYDNEFGEDECRFEKLPIVDIDFSRLGFDDIDYAEEIYRNNSSGIRQKNDPDCVIGWIG